MPANGFDSPFSVSKIYASLVQNGDGRGEAKKATLAFAVILPPISCLIHSEWGMKKRRSKRILISCQ